jgi:hypothetical protein
MIQMKSDCFACKDDRHRYDMNQTLEIWPSRLNSMIWGREPEFFIIEVRLLILERRYQ